MTAWRWLVLAAGVVALLVGGVGVVAPVSVSPVRAVVGCGTAVSARIPASTGEDAGPDYTRLCRMEIEDRRQWTLTLLGAGMAAIALTTVAGARRPRV